MINGVLNDEYTTDKCPECPYHDQCAKSQKYRKLYEPVSPAFIEDSTGTRRIQPPNDSGDTYRTIRCIKK